MKSFRTFFALFIFGAVSFFSFAQARKIDVWDFGGVQFSGENARNNISISDIDAISTLPAGGRFSDAGDITFGDLTVNVVANDRMYFQSKKGKSAGNQGYASLDFGDGYVSDGIYYCNGTGGEKRRYLLLNGVKAGDVVTFYAGTSNTSAKNVHFAHVEMQDVKDENIGSVKKQLVKTGLQDETSPIVQVSAAVAKTSCRYSYIAIADGTYKIFADSDAGKPVFYRVVREPGVSVSGVLSNLPKGKAEIKFVCRENAVEIPGVISNGKFSANLAAGFSYTAILTGIKGFGISAQTNFIDLKNAKAASAKNVSLSVSEQKTFVVKGEISGIASGYDVSKLKVVMNPPEKSPYQSAECETKLEGEKIVFESEIEPSVRYEASLSGANDYEIVSEKIFEGTKEFSKNLEVKTKDVFLIKGKFTILGGKNPAKEIPSQLKFVNMEDGYEYEAKILGSTYEASLRSGSYEAKSETANFKTQNHIVVFSSPIEKDINFIEKASVSAKDKKLPFKKDIFVGPKSEFKFVQEALDAAESMSPKSEKDRITIHIAPGVYREQITVNAPYITLKNDEPSKEVKLTWYYGIGYKYFSANASGYYDSDLAHDKFEKRGVARWGVATCVKPTATAFRAEGITFEASFNKYVTDEEVADGVEEDGSLPFKRRINSDVTSKKATERATAIITEADKCEYKNCKFLGCQDTLYTGGKTVQYFLNCFIEGQTDFIFGDGDAIFDSCEIRWCGYSEGSVGGYLTAARNAKKYGYLFSNCVVTANENLSVVAGFLGRPWGKDAKVAFIDTIFSKEGLLNGVAWTSMSGNSPEKAQFREFGSVFAGVSLDTSERYPETILKSKSGYEIKDYLDGWKPEFYIEKSSASPKFSKKPLIISNDDINTPYPGHTLSVAYEIKKLESADESEIYWCREKDGQKFTVKQSTGFSDKTYKLSKADEGAKISVIVVPKVRGGNAGASIEAQLKAKVKEGYAVVATKSSGGKRAEGKVNIFLAGDSTLKDYSSGGMWSGGKDRDEGSWGEFLPYFFNGSVAVQNFANGGRSTRNFINEGTLKKIEGQISKGDYLFIQFGHNDENLSDNDRGVLLGKPDSKGIYPTNEAKKSATSATFVSKYGDESYTESSGGSFKWFLKQYIDVAKNAGAIPVLVTPVSRLYFEESGSGKIRAHHDADGTAKSEMKNSYCEAVRQLSREEGVILIDGFEITKSLYERLWKEGGEGETRAIMTKGDTTHSSKIGGFISAAIFAKEIKSKIPSLSKAVQKPTKIESVLADGSIEFLVDSNGKVFCKNEFLKKIAQQASDSL